jgi:hypothetical protein
LNGKGRGQETKTKKRNSKTSRSFYAIPMVVVFYVVMAIRVVDL